MSQSGAYGNSGGLSSITTINGDSGSITGSTVTIYANQSTLNSGSTVKFVSSGNVSTFNVSDTNKNTVIGNGSGNISGGGITGSYNTSVGSLSLTSETGGNQNSILGSQVMASAVGGDNNVSIGFQSLRIATSPFYNTSVGTLTLSALLNGQYNTAIGYIAGGNYTGSETSNVCINAQGVIGDNNILRIGDSTGTGFGGIQGAYICGIDGVNVGSVAKVVTMASNKLGTATITAGTGITITPSANTITISTSGTQSYTYTNVNHAASPYTVLSTDEYISVDTSAGVVSLLFPNAATSGRTYVVKDRTGTAAASNITITTVGGAVNIDGFTTYVINNNYGSVQLMGNSSTYELF